MCYDTVGQCNTGPNPGSLQMPCLEDRATCATGRTAPLGNFRCPATMPTNSLPQGAGKFCYQMRNSVRYLLHRPSGGGPRLFGSAPSAAGTGTCSLGSQAGNASRYSLSATRLSLSIGRKSNSPSVATSANGGAVLTTTANKINQAKMVPSGHRLTSFPHQLYIRAILQKRGKWELICVLQMFPNPTAPAICRQSCHPRAGFVTELFSNVNRELFPALPLRDLT